MTQLKVIPTGIGTEAVQFCCPATRMPGFIEMSGMMGAGATWTVVTLDKAMAPRVPVTVKVKFVFTKRPFVDTGTPLTTGPTPPSMLPVPSAKTASSFELSPAVTKFGAAVKFEMLGGGGSVGPPHEITVIITAARNSEAITRTEAGAGNPHQFDRFSSGRMPGLAWR
jgi:hypothetical protein